MQYRYVAADLDRARSVVDLTISADADPAWPLTAARELDDLLCHLRFNEPTLGTIVLRTAGSATDVLVHDDAARRPRRPRPAGDLAALEASADPPRPHRPVARIAVIEPGSCFVGILAELALAADRSYMLDGIFEDDDDPLPAATIQLTPVNTGPMPMYNGLTRLASRFWGRSTTCSRPPRRPSADRCPQPTPASSGW